MSGFLLDTHAFIWLTENDSSLADNLRMMINSADIVYLSIVSLWEIAIKLNLGKLSLQQITPVVQPAEVSKFMLVWRIHIGLYIGAILGIVHGIVNICRRVLHLSL
ncbi:MAG: PIN domain-containing protein [Nostoc sp.]